jgi:hypothetical protein
VIRRDNVKVPVGGAPVTQRFAKEIGADGYAADAVSVNRLANIIAAEALMGRDEFCTNYLSAYAHQYLGGNESAGDTLRYEWNSTVYGHKISRSKRSCQIKLILPDCGSTWGCKTKFPFSRIIT